MKLIRVGAAVLNQTPLDWHGNTNNILGCIREARDLGVSILCLPELCLTGYGCEDAFLSRGVQVTAFQVLQEIVFASYNIIVSVGLPVLHHNALFNAVCLIANQKILGFVAKRHLAGDGIHYEPRWFKPWPHQKRARIEGYPIGDLYFNLGGVKIGFEICEDAWVAKRPGADLSLKGVDIILNPSASHFAFGKYAIRERLVLEGSRAFGVSYVYANLLGNEAGRIIYDGEALIASNGKMVARGSRFSFADRRLTTAVIDIDATRMIQARSASFQPDLDEDCVSADFAFPECDPVSAEVEQAAWETSPYLKEEEFTRAVSLGLFDYLRKSGSQGLVVSLSGGCDSSVVAALCTMMIEFAVAELSLDGLNKKLSMNVKSTQDAVHTLLTCVYQSTRNSTYTTQHAARVVAEALGATFIKLDVDGFFNDYATMIEKALGRELSWENDDLALQNIQARVRGPGVWLIANLKNALLLATSNRSEAAVGYATMDGDTCGGLSPIAGIDKAFLRKYLVWLEKVGPFGLHPIPQISVVTAQIPTAELRPREQAQTDENDLMPYDVLDAIERAAIRDKQMPSEVLRNMRAVFPHIDHGQLALWIERFFKLWCRNQWKRERYAPSFHLDDENLDPKTWCRFPILSSGFATELSKLR